MFTVYILFSENRNRYYIGYTGDDVIIRLKKHNTQHSGFTGKTLDWKIVYTEKYAEKQQALLREKELKKWKSRVMIEKLIYSNL